MPSKRNKILIVQVVNKLICNDQNATASTWEKDKDWEGRSQSKRLEMIMLSALGMM
jgi:hypothetical protein